MLIAASLLAIVLSLIVPKWAMLGYLFNLADEPIRWFLRRRKTSLPESRKIISQ